MEDKIEITITPEDCIGAVFENPLRCPLAIAIRKAIRKKFGLMVLVGDNQARINYVKYSFDSNLWNELVMNEMGNKNVTITLNKIKHETVNAQAT